MVGAIGFFLVLQMLSTCDFLLKMYTDTFIKSKNNQRETSRVPNHQ